MIEKLSFWLTRRPKRMVILSILLLIPCLAGMAATRINYDILTYLPPDLDSTKGEALLEDPFHDAATSMLIVEGMPPQYTDDLLRSIQKVPGVSNALWISDVVGVQIPTDMLPENLRSSFYSGDSTMMVIQFQQPGASEETMNAIDEIRGLCNTKCFLAGFSVIIKDTKDLVNRELPQYILLAVVLSLAAMAVAMESWVLPLIFLFSIALAIVYNFGTNVFMGQISYITQAIAAVLQLGVTMDYSIFLYHRYREERQNYARNEDAMAQAVQAAFSSLTGSSLTTIAGFLALCFMRLTLGRDIGIVMAKGVVLGILTVIFILPSYLLLFDKYIQRFEHKSLLPDFSRVNQGVIRHRKLLFILFLVLFLPSLYNQNHTQVYYKLDESLPQDMPSIVATNKLKDDYNMATTHFVVLRDDLSAVDLNAMEQQLEAVPGVENLTSYHKILGSGIPDFFVPEEVRDMLKQGGKQLMMITSRYATASDQVADQLAQMKKIVKSYDGNAYITGEAALTNDLIDVCTVDFRVTNYISIAAIFLIVAIVFKSITVPVALVASIELAIFINQGVPYLTGTTIPFISPTVIGCVQLGATVDYAILMTTRFQEELRNGKTRQEAAHIAATTSDHSIMTSSLVMFCATLGVGLISRIEIISSICMMLARGALISAVVSMFLTPAILCVLEPVFAKTSWRWKSKPKPE